jgi:hypothetical protein
MLSKNSSDKLVLTNMFKQNLFWLSLSILAASTLNASISFGSDSDSTTVETTTTPPATTTTAETSKASASRTDNGIGANSPQLKTENPQPVSPEVKEAVVPKPASPEVKEAASPKPVHKTTKLFGRIEQIAGESGAQFPVVLKAMTAKMDTSNRTPLKGGAADGLYSGSLASSFPVDYSGNWGGSLTVWQAQFDPICWQIDPEEVNRTRALIKPGSIGQVNFQFRNGPGRKIDLEPAQVVFMVPMKDTRYQEQIGSMLGSNGQAGGMTLPGMNSGQVGAMMQQMMANMNVPIMLNFGEVNSQEVEGLSGNAFRSTVIKNSIRELSPTVFEQQIVTSEVQRNKKTNSTRNEYSETVIRFTKQTASQLYVQAASVNYTADKRFERKFILYGTINHGASAANSNANPLSGAGFGNLFNQPGGTQMPKLPGGQNPLQNLFGPQ